MTPSGSVTLKVIAMPGPQGSKAFKGLARNGRAILVESSKKVKPWREAVLWAAREAGKSVNGPVSVRITFTLPKPKGAPKRRRTLPDKKPDLSKLVRATEDALTDAGVIEDDARIVHLDVWKAFPNEHERALDVPGAHIEITEVA